MSEKATNFFGKYTEQVNAMFKEQAGVVESMTSEWNKVRGQGLEQAQVVMEAKSWQRGHLLRSSQRKH